MINFNKKRSLWLIPFLVYFIFFININTAKAVCSDGKESVKYDDPQLKNFGCGANYNCFNFCRDKNTGVISFTESPGVLAGGGGESGAAPSIMTITDATCNNGICSGGKISEDNVQSGVVTHVEYNASGTPESVRQETVVDGSFITKIAASVVGFAAFIINYIISIILGVVINLEAWFVEIVLEMNDQILKSAFVQSGYQISLAVTNLIFVGGIIVVAIATILRWESYSMKKILWKLILMAVLVNFGLSIAGAIIRISTNFSWYFLNAVNPGGGTGAAHYGAFATAIAGAFTPQRFFITDIFEGGVTTTPEGSKNVTGQITQKDQGNLAGIFGSSLAQILTPIVSIFFTIAFLVVIIITLGALVVMLINRYITISLLLMLLPFAWAFWAFPNINEFWTLWWKKFIRWTFFAPAVLFFLYLCLLTLRATPGGGNAGVHIQGVDFTFDKKGALGGLDSFGGSFLMNLMVPILNAIVMTGCAIGSLKVANELGIEGSKKALSIASGAAKSVGMFAANRAAGLGAAGLNKLLPKTPPPPEKGRLGRTLHTVGFKAGQLAEKVGVRKKIEETAEKYGPSKWPYLPNKQRKEQIEKIKNEIDNINKELKDIPSAINRRQEEIQNLEQQLNTIKSKYDPDFEKLQKAISKIQSQIKTETDHIKLAQLSQQKQALEAEQNKIIQQINEETKPLNDQISNIQNELKDLRGTLISKREEKYKEIRDLKPEGIFGTVINSVTGSFKKEKVKLSKEQLEKAGIEIEGEKKEEPKQNQQQNQQSQTKKV